MDIKRTIKKEVVIAILIGVVCLVTICFLLYTTQGRGVELMFADPSMESGQGISIE